MEATLIKLAKKSPVPSAALTLTEIWIYPIKSLGGIRMKTCRVWEKGLEFDRRYMLVDSSNEAMTQRQFPQMALFKTSLENQSIRIVNREASISVPAIPVEFNAAFNAKIFDDTVTVHELSAEASSWFSERLGINCKLVYFPEGNARPVDSRYQINGEHVSLADAYPLMIIGQRSLDDLNSRLKEPVPMNRFRPNLVFDGADPFAEDAWKEFNIGDNRFAVVKPCARCVLTTVDQSSGMKGTEPLRTLSAYRNQNNKVLFGQNVIVLSATEIHEGDAITFNGKMNTGH